ncbi:hypothetical protein B0T26DRAFT_690504, partial [Lasiosphaeria miniovina]
MCCTYCVRHFTYEALHGLALRSMHIRGVSMDHPFPPKINFSHFVLITIPLVTRTALTPACSFCRPGPGFVPYLPTNAPGLSVLVHCVGVLFCVAKARKETMHSRWEVHVGCFIRRRLLFLACWPALPVDESDVACMQTAPGQSIVQSS